MDINLDSYQILDKFNVSRETYHILDEFRELVLYKNKEINLIGAKTINNFVERHIVDCAQAIDFIDKNNKTCTDLGSGAGLPGVVLAIVLRDKSINIKMNLHPFTTINPCGFSDLKMAQLSDFSDNINMKEIQNCLIKNIQKEF